MAITLDGTNGISTPDLESSGPVTGTTATFSGNVTLGSSVLATPAGSAPSYTCRAWVNFDGTGIVWIRASGNVSSITDNGTGNYTVNFTTAMPNANYSATATTGTTNTRGVAVCQSPATGNVQTLTSDGSSGGQYDSASVSVSIFR